MKHNLVRHFQAKYMKTSAQANQQSALAFSASKSYLREGTDYLTKDFYCIILCKEDNHFKHSICKKFLHFMCLVLSRNFIKVNAWRLKFPILVPKSLILLNYVYISMHQTKITSSPYTTQLPTSHAQFLEFSNLRQQSELDGMTCQVNSFQFLQSEMYLVFKLK